MGKTEYKAGTIVFENWTIAREIGEGSFGTVYELRREDFGEVYLAAMKVIRVPQDATELRDVLNEGMTEAQAKEYFYSMVESITHEFSIMARLKGTANVVGYDDHMVIAHEDGIGWDILIRMELLTPLLTYAYQHPLARRDIIQLGIDMCKALTLCQRYNTIHRDIKPENIFVSQNGDYKLGDFGIARTIERTTSGLSKKGTYSYMAPEVYRGEDYGFSVDLYSLGLVLYRLLNRNRLPFLPQPPDPIVFSAREQAMAKRMSGEPIPKPVYAEGRLAEIVQKACAFDPRDRYSSPGQMQQELEGILYEQSDSALIYPDGDEIALVENQYAAPSVSHKMQSGSLTGTERTSYIFSEVPAQDSAATGTAKTDRIFEKTTAQKKADGTSAIFSTEEKVTSSKKKKAPIIVCALLCFIIFAAGAGFYLHRKSVSAQEQAAQQERYIELMDEGTKACETDPAAAAELFLQAQEIFPDDPAPYTSYAYSLYCLKDYESCITYIEDSLALGKDYPVAVQNELSEILGAAYFELDDYAAAASFFRLSTAGGDITVPAMRDYAVSLGRLGDVEMADEVLQRMYSAGADDSVTDYVQAEVDYAREEYAAAEIGFKTVLNTTDDIALQRRSLRSLAEVYRDCAALARSNSSPISAPATKAVEVLADGIERYGLRYDTTLWEMLGLAYFESYHTDPSVTDNYLTKAAECFERVIEQGIQKDYLYSNLYAIFYELEQFDDAERVLNEYETAFPNDYMPHAFRGLMLITIENAKEQSARNYQEAKAELEAASKKIRSSDDTTYYMQLESLVNQLIEEGWL